MAALFELDLQDLLKEVASDLQCGMDLEYDPDFIRLEAALQGKPETQYGDTISAAIPPDWKVVHALALGLFERSRDLRLAVALTRAEMHLHGIDGFAAGLKLIANLLESRWESVHPQLDPDDDNDPILRVNTISTLVDRNSILGELRKTPVVISRTHGRYSLRDIDISTGELLAGPDESPVSIAVIDAAFMDLGEGELEKTYGAVADAHDAVAKIETVLTSHVGNSQSVDLSALSKALARLRDFVGERRAHGAPSTDQVTASEGRQSSPANRVGTGNVVNADISTPQDVQRMLGKLIEYYARFEPSSPIPLLLKRAERLVNKSFMEIMTDMAPDGLSQIYLISGTQPADE